MSTNTTTNVLDFNEAKQSKEYTQSQSSAECDHEHVCEHCDDKFYHVDNFLTSLFGEPELSIGKKQFDFETLTESAEELYEDAYSQGKRDALESIIGYSAYQLDMDSDDEDDYYSEDDIIEYDED